MANQPKKEEAVGDDKPKIVGVEIDQQFLIDAVKSVVEKGLADGVGSWETQRLISDAVQASLDTAELPRLIQEALTGRMETESEAIVAAVVEDTLPMLRAALSLAFREAFRGMIYGLVSGPPDKGGYMSDAEKAAWRRAQEVMGEVAAPA